MRVDGRPANAAYIADDGITVTSQPVAANDTYGVGETIRVQVEFDQKVNVDTANGIAQLRVSIGDNDNTPRRVDLRYVRGSGSRKLAFEYVVQEGDADGNGIYIGANRLKPYGATISGANNGRPAVLLHTGAGNFPGHKVDDTLAPPRARLEDLTLSGTTLSPAFSPLRSVYAAHAAADIAETTVAATLPPHCRHIAGRKHGQVQGGRDQWQAAALGSEPLRSRRLRQKRPVEPLLGAGIPAPHQRRCGV